MKVKIYSSYGVLDCEPMTLQAIEKSIPVGTNEQTDENQGEFGSESVTEESD